MTTKMVNMEFDGKAVSVPEGMTLVDAAATVGVHIPNLCHIKELRGVGACRMCMVEIEGMKAPMTACTTRTKEGMKVQTKTAKVEEIRKFVTDLVLSFHPLDCMTCPKAGACDLQRYAADLGIRESSFGRKSFNYELNDKSPFITIDNNYCILCGRCVRVCKEQGTNVLDFMGRGITTKVSTALDKPLHESGCTFCGSCVEACPVNTIMERDRWQHGREWDLEKHESVCTACGSGCSVVVSKKDGRIVKVNTKEENGYICVIGRFGFDSLNAGNRITTPMKKQGGKLVPTTWEEASKLAADALKKAGANAGFIASGSLTNEEAMAIHSLARDVVGSANIDTPASAYAGGAIAALRAVYGEAGLSIASQADLKSADCVVVIGADPTQKGQSLQEVDVMIRRRAQAGAKIIVVNPDKIGLTTHANAVHLELKPGTDAALLAGVMSAALAEGLTTSQKGLDGLKKSLVSADEAAKISGVTAEKIAEAAKAFAASKLPVVIFGTGISANEDASLQALNLALLKNAGVMPLMLEANALGVMQMGCLPDKKGKGYREMKSGMKALYIAGSVPDADFKADFIIVQASHANTLTETADLVLPMSALYEKHGTIINTYGAHKAFAQAQQPAGEIKDGVEITAEISAAVSKTKAFKAKDIASLVKKIKAGKLGAGAFNPVNAAAAKPYGISGAVLLIAMNRGLLSNSAVIGVIEVREPVPSR
ncbi:MAG TPA: molybdopterin-dependent oxidoreductase [Nitrospirota bacterium]|nr:molybdopterin-dependent oxidoreductase [Nitrospirota bacterium]